MATITKSVSGSTTTFVITDNESVTCTVAASMAATTGMTTTISTTSLHTDGLQQLFNLLNQLQTGLIPGAGAQTLNP